MPSESALPASPSSPEPAPTDRPAYLKWRDRLFAEGEVFERLFPSGPDAVEVRVGGFPSSSKGAIERTRQPGYTLFTRDAVQAKAVVVLDSASKDRRGLEAWLLGVIHAQLLDDAQLVEALRADLGSEAVDSSQRERLARCAARAALDTTIRDFGGAGMLLAELEPSSSSDELHAIAHACAVELIEELSLTEADDEAIRAPHVRLALFQVMARFEHQLSMEELRRLTKPSAN